MLIDKTKQLILIHRNQNKQWHKTIYNINKWIVSKHINKIKRSTHNRMTTWSYLLYVQGLNCMFYKVSLLYTLFQIQNMQL